jgi:hypothetical protein
MASAVARAYMVPQRSPGVELLVGGQGVSPLKLKAFRVN